MEFWPLPTTGMVATTRGAAFGVSIATGCSSRDTRFSVEPVVATAWELPAAAPACGSSAILFGPLLALMIGGKHRQHRAAEHSAIAEGTGRADHDQAENRHGGDERGSRPEAAGPAMTLIRRGSLVVGIMLIVALISLIVGRKRKDRQIARGRHLRGIAVILLRAVALQGVAGLFAETVELSCRTGKEAAPGRLFEALVRLGDCS